jgi:non-ribosomal peptide synthetase component E (peptide arylation enzyme)
MDEVIVISIVVVVLALIVSLGIYGINKYFYEPDYKELCFKYNGTYKSPNFCYIQKEDYIQVYRVIKINDLYYLRED